MFRRNIFLDRFGETALDTGNPMLRLLTRYLTSFPTGTAQSGLITNTLQAALPSLRRPDRLTNASFSRFHVDSPFLPTSDLIERLRSWKPQKPETAGAESAEASGD